MRIICSWCERFIREKEPLEDESMSDGICEECYEKANIKNKKSKEEKERKSGGTEEA